MKRSVQIACNPVRIFIYIYNYYNKLIFRLDKKKKFLIKNLLYSQDEVCENILIYGYLPIASFFVLK